jgi:hypothetical protein
LGLDSALLALGASLGEVVASLEAELSLGESTEHASLLPALHDAAHPSSGGAGAVCAAPPPCSDVSPLSLGPLPPKRQSYDISATSAWLHSMRQAFVRELFDFHALRGDVQTCVTVARVLLLAFPAYQTHMAAGKSDFKPHTINALPDVGVGFTRLARWEERYVTLLHSLRLWSPASTVMACSSHPTIQSLNVNGTSVQLARSGKRAKMALPAAQRPEVVMRSSMHPVLVPGKRLWTPALDTDASSPSVVLRSSASLPATDSTTQSVVLAHGTMSGLAVRNWQQAAGVCAVCCLPVLGLFTQCNFCGVGGHTSCLKRWFETHTHAPASGGHACVRPEQSLSHTDHVRADASALWPSEGAAHVKSAVAVAHTSHGFELIA